MNERFIAFDVETPNHLNDRMSAIGITVIDAGKITDEFYTLVNPEENFDYFNIRLTGITPAAVSDKPTFPMLWEQIEPIMSGGVLMAHSATFDMGVLTKCLSHYDISWQPYTPYVCTCTMGRACYPGLKNHKLNTLCNFLNINLSHHNAGSDSHACATLLLNYLSNGINVQKYIRSYCTAGLHTGTGKA